MRRFVSIGIASMALMVGLLAAWSQAGEKPGEKAKTVKEAADRDAKLLEGEWMVVGMEDDGVMASDDDVKGMKWLFKKIEITATDPDGTSGRMSFKLDPGKKPKEIDVTPLNGPCKGKAVVGIYELEEGRLRVCLGYLTAAKGRPTEFATTAGSGLGMITFEKRKR